MIGDPYESDEEDPAYYPGTKVLKNLPNIQDGEALEEFEVEAVGERSLQPPPPGDFDISHYRALHHHLFQDVFSWAGEYRTIRTGKGGNWFCYPEHIEKEMAKLFVTLDRSEFQTGVDQDTFVKAVSEFLGELNAIHPFREGNGRTQLFFVRLIGQRAGHPFRSEAVERDAFVHAMIESFHCKLDALIDELERMLA